MSLNQEEIVRALKRVPMFRNLADRQLQHMAKRVRERNYQEGEVILKQGELGIGLFIIRDGEVRIVRRQEDGSERELDVIGNGAFFGELSLLDDATRVANVIATMPTQCLALTKLDFLEELEADPRMAIEMLKELAHRFRRVVTAM